jgi:hypothetical protein
MLNEEGKKSIAYIVLVISHIVLACLITRNFLDSEESYILEASDSVDWEVAGSEITQSLTPTTTPIIEDSNDRGKVVDITPTPTLEFDSSVEKYIFEVFGEHYDKARLLLEGNENCHGENPSLNPYADNDNTWWGGIGIDRGYWQINTYYHPHITEECARDIKCSTDYAWRMFKNDNYTFRRWTAGRCLGI